MDSLIDIQFEVESFMKDHSKDNGMTLWEKLVESSRKINGGGCDGILMGEVEEYAEELLAKIDSEVMYQIWLGTENGTIAIEQGFDDPERCEMIHDIAIDVYQEIVESICQEAKKGMTKKKRKA